MAGAAFMVGAGASTEEAAFKEGAALMAAAGSRREGVFAGALREGPHTEAADRLAERVDSEDVLLAVMHAETSTGPARPE